MSGRLGPLYLTTAAAIWGGMYVVSRALMATLPPWVLLEMRFVIGLAVLGLAAWKLGEWRVRRDDLPALALLGATGYTCSIGMQFIGTDLAGAALGSLITAASPALIALFAQPLLGERLTGRAVLAMLLATLGVVAVMGLPSEPAGGSRVLLGGLVLLGAAVTWALYTVLSRRQTRHYSSLTVTLWASLFGTAFTLPVSWWQWTVERPQMPGDTASWLGILYLGVVSTAVAFYLWNKGFERTAASTGALYFFAQPLVGGLLGALLLGESLGRGFVLGAVLIVGGVYLTATASRSDSDNKTNCSTAVTSG